MQSFLHHLRTIQFTLTFVCFSVDTVLLSVASTSKLGTDVGWFLLPDFIALLISGYYIISVEKQWNKNSANVDISYNIFLIILWIIYGCSKAYVYSVDFNGFALLTLIYGWFNVGLYLASSLIYCEYF